MGFSGTPAKPYLRGPLGEPTVRDLRVAFDQIRTKRNHTLFVFYSRRIQHTDTGAGQGLPMMSEAAWDSLTKVAFCSMSDLVF